MNLQLSELSLCSPAAIMAAPPSQKSLAFLRSIIIIRLSNAFWVTTFFQPDEFFQSLEPAWDLAFGSKSGAWLTWVCISSRCGESLGSS